MGVSAQGIFFSVAVVILVMTEEEESHIFTPTRQIGLLFFRYCFCFSAGGDRKYLC